MAEQELKGRSALVTGAASGIGAAIVARLRAAGAVVAGMDLQPSPHADCAVIADLRKAAQLAAAFDQVQAQIGMPHIFVHAAAIQRQGGCLDGDPADWADIYDVNVIGAVRCMHWCVPAMRERGGGAVLLLSSINAEFATPTLAGYAASKAALNSLTKTAALEFAADGVRVNAIAPASIDTPLLRASFGDGAVAELALQRNAQRHPIARLGTAEEVAELALFLVGDRSRWITGAIHNIDGGASVTRR